MIFNFHKQDGIIPFFIRWFSFGEYNHVSIQIFKYIYEAHLRKGVTKTHVYNYDRDSIVLSIEVKLPHERIAKKWVEKQVGKKYDLMGTISFLWVILRPKKGKWFCSELAKATLSKGLGSKRDEFNNRVSPQVFYEELLDIMEVL